MYFNNACGSSAGEGTRDDSTRVNVSFDYFVIGFFLIYVVSIEMARSPCFGC